MRLRSEENADQDSYLKKLASTHEYLRKEKCQVDLDDGCNRITELTEKIA